MKLRLYVLLLGLVFLSGCATTAGLLDKGKYTSPLGNFEVVIPPDYKTDQMGAGEVRDYFDPKQSRGFVSITKPWTPMLAIKYSRNETPRSNKKAYIEAAFARIFEDNRNQRSRDAVLIYDEWISLDGDEAYFTLTNLPTAAPYTSNGKTDTAEQCLVMFFKGNYGYIISVEGHTPPIYTNQKRLGGTDETVKSYRRTFERFYSSITFKK